MLVRVLVAGSVALVALFSPGPLLAQSVKLNGPLAAAPGLVGQRASTPDGRMAVYLAQQDSEAFEVYVAPITGGPGVRVSAALAPGESVYSFHLSPDSRRVAYHTQGGSGGTHLFAAALDGGGVVALDASPDTDGRVHQGSARFSPDAQWVLFTAQIPVQGHLFAVPASGGVPINLSGPTTFDAGAPQVLADSSAVVFVANGGGTATSEIFRAPIDGSAPPVRVSPPATRRGSVGVFALSPDEQWIVFGSTLTSASPRLVSLPLAGGVPVELDLVSNSTGYPVPQVTSDSRRVFFLDVAPVTQQLFSAPIDGSAPTRRVESARPVEEFQLASDGLHAVFATRAVRELFSVPADGVVPVPLLAAGFSFANPGGHFAIRADGARVVYTALEPGQFAANLYTVPIEGGTSRLLARGTFNPPLLSPDGRLAAFLDAGERRVHLVGTSGGPVIVLSPRSTLFTTFQFSADSRRLLLGSDLETPRLDELFQVSIVGGRPVKLNGTLAPLTTFGGRVESFALAPGEERAFYAAAEAEYPSLQAFSAAADGSAHARLDAPEPGATIEELRPTPDGARVVLKKRALSGEPQLFSALSAGGDLRRLTPALVPGFELADFELGPRGRSVVYRAGTADERRLQLYGVPITGGPSLRLNPTLVEGGEVASYAYAGTLRVLYLADQEVDERLELYAVSAPPLANVRLSGALPAGETLAAFLVTRDGRSAVYRTISAAFATTGLFVVPSDGSAAPVRLTLPDGTPARPPFETYEFTPDGTAVLFREGGRLYRAPATGGVTLELGADVVLAGDVVETFQISPDGSRVAFQAHDASGSYRLHTTATSGGPSGTVLVARFPGLYRFTQDATQLVFLGTTSSFSTAELYVVSGLGGPAVKLADTALGAFRPFELDPDGVRAGFRGLDDNFYVVPLDGSSAPVRVNEFDAALASDYRLGRERAFFLATARSAPFPTELFSRAYSTLP
jgi:Tol biopolymer transport system component